jgi:probable HAF family extracellular repeat protein
MIRNRPTSTMAGTLGAIVLATAAAALAERPRYRAQALQPHEGVLIRYSHGYALNNHDVAVGNSTGPIEIRATRWHADGTMQGLDYVGYPQNNANDINASNQVTGRVHHRLDRFEAALWEADGSVMPLGGLWELYSGLSESFALNDSTVVVGTSTDDSLAFRAFRWTKATGMVDIGTLGGPGAIAEGINNQGLIVGISSTADLDVRGFLYDEVQLIDLGAFWPGGISAAVDINESGQIVGYADLGPMRSEPTHAVLWEPTPDGHVMIDLGAPEESWHSFAVAINNLGQIVGNARDPDVPGSPGDHPWIWEDGEMTLLEDLLPPDSGWVLWQVRDINDNGRITGSDLDGHDLGFVLIPLVDGDLDYDGDVDLADLAQLLSNYGTTGGATYADGDLDEDGDVDLADLAALLAAYGTQT